MKIKVVKTCGKNARRKNCEEGVQEHLKKNKCPLENQERDE
jgi:hypothetical protein